MVETILAPAVRSFAAQIQLFGDSVPDGVGPWLLPLARVLGPMRIPQGATTGDPDGYDGLTRRGPYERLLASEWVFALDEPDEFMRRAVMHEHMFLAPQYREPGGARASVALFDTGPLQLGAPRLAQLALLVVLAKRAAAAGAGFRFGMLQDPDAGLLELDGEAIRRWMQARSWAPAGVHVTTWQERVAELAAQDVWVIGADGTRRDTESLRAHAVTIEELDGSTGPALRVQTHRRDAVGEAVTLPLPAPGLALQVLRHPFAPPRWSQAAREAPASRAFGRLSFDGRRLLLPRPGGGCIGLHIPSSPREPQGRAKHVLLDRGHALVAADIHAKRPIALFVQGGELIVAGSGLVRARGYMPPASAASSLGELVRTGIQLPATLQPDDDDRAGTQLHVIVANTTTFRAWVVDPTHQVWELELGARADSKELVECALSIRDRQGANFTRIGPAVVGWVSHMLATAVTTPPFREWELHDGEYGECLFGAPQSDGTPTLAYPHGERVVIHHDGATELPRPVGRLFGLAFRYVSGGKPLPHLLFVAPDGRTVRWRSRDGDEELFIAPGAIEEIRYEPACRKILYRGVAGHRGVYAIERKAMVWHALPGSSP